MMWKESNSFLSYLKFEKGVSDNTIKQYTWDINKFYSFVKKDNIIEVVTQDIRDYLYYLQSDRKYKPKSIGRRIACLKSLFKFLSEEKIVTDNPVLRIKSPKVAKKNPVFLTEEEIRSLLLCAKENIRNYFIIYLFINTGLRISELTALNVDDIDTVNKVLKVKHGKGDKERSIPLSDLVISHYKEYLDTSGVSSGNLFKINKDKISNNTIRYMLKELCSKAGITKRISPHKLRSSFATLLYKKGTSIYNISKLLGHENIATTQIYTALDIDKLKEDVDKLNF